ncbi:unnamed protein product, partial [Rotaria magnacalcarata]
MNRKYKFVLKIINHLFWSPKLPNDSKSATGTILPIAAIIADRSIRSSPLINVKPT